MTYVKSGPIPHNLEVERSLIGCILKRNEVMFEVSDIVSKADFYENFHAECFLLCRDLIETNRQATPQTLLLDQSQDVDIGGGIPVSEYLRMLYERAPHPSFAKNLAMQIRDLAGKRGLLEIYQTAIDDIRGAPASLSGLDIRGHVDGKVDGLFPSLRAIGIRRIGDYANDVLEAAGKAITAERKVGISLGLKSAEDLTGPLMPGRLYVIGASSGGGKSAFLLNVAKFAARDQPPDENGVIQPPRRVSIEQLEMPADELTERSLAAETGISASEIEAGVMSEDKYRKLDAAVKNHQALEIYIPSGPLPTVEQIRARAMRQKKLKGLDLLMIDHLLYVKSSNPRESAVEAVETNMKALKELAKDMDIPVVVAAQLNAAYTKGEIRRPQLGDFWNSSAVERNADCILMVWREDYLLKRREPQAPTNDNERMEFDKYQRRLAESLGKAEFILVKRRGGEGTGYRQCWFDGPTVSFSDTAPRGARESQARANGRLDIDR